MTHSETPASSPKKGDRQLSIRLLRRTEVEEIVGLRRSAIYDRIAKGTFPQPVRFKAARAVRWRLSDIDTWLEENIVA